MKVKEVMNKVFVIEPDISLKQASKLMSDKGIGSLVVMKKDKIVGIITERDIIKNIGKIGQKVSAVMSKNVIFTNENENLDDTAKVMSDNKIKRLPVLEKGRLVGIITVTDILANSEALNEEFLLE